MRNIFIIALILVSLGYMISILFDRYENIKETSAKIEKQNKNK